MGWELRYFFDEKSGEEVLDLPLLFALNQKKAVQRADTYVLMGPTIGAKLRYGDHPELKLRSKCGPSGIEKWKCCSIEPVLLNHGKLCEALERRRDLAPEAIDSALSILQSPGREELPVFEVRKRIRKRMYGRVVVEYSRITVPESGESLEREEQGESSEGSCRIPAPERDVVYYTLSVEGAKKDVLAFAETKLPPIVYERALKLAELKPGGYPSVLEYHRRRRKLSGRT